MEHAKEEVKPAPPEKKEGMELNAFVQKALTNIIEGVEEAQKEIWYGEIIPKKEGKRGEVDIDFEVAVEAKSDKVFVVMPPAQPMPHLSKLRFKIPVRLPPKGCMDWCWQILTAPYTCLQKKSRKTRPQKPVEQKSPLQAQPPKEEERIFNYLCVKLRKLFKGQDAENKGTERSSGQGGTYRG